MVKNGTGSLFSRWIAWGIALVWLSGAAGAPVAWAATKSVGPQDELRFVDEVTRGAKAYEAGHLAQARQAFQAAWMIHPDHPEVNSWLTLVQQAQTQRDTAIYSSVTERIAEATPSWEELGAAAYEPPRPAYKLPFSKSPIASQFLEPVESTRPEITGNVTRAGFQKLYKEGIGFQPVKGIGLSGRTEIFEEPNPVEALILDAQVLRFSEISQFRRSITPLFTRSAAGRLVLDYEPLPRFTYEYDGRTTLHQFQTKFGFKDIDLQTHAFNLLYTFPRIRGLGVLTVRPWYKRVLQSSDHDLGAFEHKDEMIFEATLQPNPNVELFFSTDQFDASKTRTIGSNQGRLYKGQLRLRVPKLKLFAIPSYEHSRTVFSPGDDAFVKQDLFVDWGFDASERIRVSSKEQMIFTELTQPAQTPSHPNTQVFNTFNTLSYELLKDFDVSVGLDYSRGFSYSNFNNVAFRLETELFKPGLIRSKFGYEWVNYYNISSYLSLLYWKFSLFQ